MQSNSGTDEIYENANQDGQFSRRQFVSLMAATVVGGSTLASRAMAGPFTAADFDKLVPADKKLSPEWIKSLFERGTPTIYRGKDLQYIGMPIGGITTGQLYLGGDGRLWHWDIFNSVLHTGDGNYAHPVSPDYLVEQGFSLAITSEKSKPRTLDAQGFSEVGFSGQYPIGTVQYSDADCPVTVSLEAFSPFIPLNVDDSSIPATVFRFTLTNKGASAVEAELTGHLQNAVGLYSGAELGGTRRNDLRRAKGLLLLNCIAEAPSSQKFDREPIVFETFEGADYGKWTSEGKAFGNGPAKGATTPDQHLSGFLGVSLANSLAGGSDEPQGKLTSPPFTIERKHINFLIGGGDHAHETCINLLLDGKTVRTRTGKNTDAMEWASWNVMEFAGKTATIEIVDHNSGGWGHIDVDQIEFADSSRNGKSFGDAPDIGSVSLALMEATEADGGLAAASRNRDGAWVEEKAASVPIVDKLIGALTKKISLAQGASTVVTFVLGWNFPNLMLDRVIGGTGRYYANKFKTADDVVSYVTSNFDRLHSTTRLFRDTWYDSTLPFWFLDRTLQNTSILATSTAHRFANGRFYGWEGVGCCEGTCTHVWQYQQATGRLFPELERLLRERADFDPQVGMRPDGMIDHRGEFGAGQAVDGQAGIIFRAYRDHQMSPDDTFLKRNWESIKKATGWLIAQDLLDGGADGILRGAQHNTLDAEWYGPVAWLSGMYIGALRAAQMMAIEVGDAEFANICQSIFEVGRKTFVKLLFDGEYFINIPDPKHLDAINSGNGCEIDQLLGQSWTYQVGLGRIFPEAITKTALKSLYRYNFSPDVGPYRKANKPGRWYAMPGEAGLLVCTFPRADWQYTQAKGKGPEWAAQYFNECQNGYEYEVAGHMIWEGLLLEGLAVTRAIHDRYHGSRRNPWNEVECGDHYSRSMASYGVFLAACGYEYHGPKGWLAFAPRLNPEDFKCAFTTAEGWGQFSQKMTDNSLTAKIDLKYGTLRLSEMGLSPKGAEVKSVTVTAGGQPVEAKTTSENGRVRISLASPVSLRPGAVIDVHMVIA